MKKILNVIIAAAAALSISSCSMPGLTGDAQPSEAPTADTAAREPANNISVGVVNNDGYNPITTASSTVRDVCGFIFEPLFDTDGSMMPQAVLAEDFDYNADGRGMTVYLKQGIKWHDGSELTARDVVYTINRIKMSDSVYESIGELIAGVSAADNYTVDISFSRAVPQAASMLIFPIVKNGSMNGSFSPIGTGPFYMSGGRLAAYEEYHGGRASIDEILIKDIPDNGKYLSMFNASAIDIANSDMIDMTGFMPKSNSTVHDYISGNMVFVGFNTQSRVFSEESARQAVSRLIDRDSIATHIYYSRAKASEYSINPSSWLSFDTRSKLRSDNTQAADFMKQGGWTPGENGVYRLEKNSGAVDFEVELLVNSDSAERVKAAEEISRSMNALGMRTVVTECGNQRFNARIAAMNYDMFIGETELLTNNDITPLAASSGNFFGYSDEETDILIAQLGTVKDEDSVKQVSIQLYQRLFDKMPFAPVCFMKKSIVSSAKLKYGVAPSVSGFVRATEKWGVK